MSTKTNRAIAAAAAVSIALTTFTVAPAAASPLYGPIGAPVGVTEVGYRHHDGGAAALGAFAAIAGTIATIAAAEHYRRHAYDDVQPYAYGPAYSYGHGPSYSYGNGPSYSYGNGPSYSYGNGPSYSYGNGPYYGGWRRWHHGW